MRRADFLVEIGTEELPPKSLLALAEAFRDGVAAGLDAAGLTHGAALAYATPRRLAVLVRQLLDQQPEQRLERRGPPVSAAFDAAGKPTRAAMSFARAALACRRPFTRCRSPTSTMARTTPTWSNG